MFTRHGADCAHLCGASITPRFSRYCENKINVKLISLQPESMISRFRFSKKKLLDFLWAKKLFLGGSCWLTPPFIHSSYDIDPSVLYFLLPRTLRGASQTSGARHGRLLK